jgi:hypothetical protein
MFQNQKSLLLDLEWDWDKDMELEEPHLGIYYLQPSALGLGRQMENGLEARHYHPEGIGGGMIEIWDIEVLLHLLEAWVWGSEEGRGEVRVWRGMEMEGGGGAGVQIAEGREYYGGIYESIEV